MMCTYGLNYQSIVYLCSLSAGPTESKRPNRCQRRGKTSPYGSAEVQIKPNDLILRRSAEIR